MMSMNHGTLSREGNISVTGASEIFRAGFTNMPNAILQSPNISDGAKVTFGLLLKYSSTRSSTNLIEQLLLDRSIKSKTTVRKELAELRDLGLVAVNSIGEGFENRYEVIF
tara:strand:+ start:4554 stop:4886 length:333 start_codon:yes stop_codon:yes gene_type:complete